MTGRPEGLRRALEIVKPRGTVVMKSTFHGEAPRNVLAGRRRRGDTPGFALRPVSSGDRSAGVGSCSGEAAHVARAGLDDYESAFADARRALKILFELEPMNS